MIVNINFADIDLIWANLLSLHAGWRKNCWLVKNLASNNILKHDFLLQKVERGMERLVDEQSCS